jgi:type 1 fimbriae regulatory protein FimB
LPSNRGINTRKIRRGINTRTLQGYLGHRGIQSTVRYTDLAPNRFKNLWR